MSDTAAKGGKRLVNRGKRHLQTMRTFLSVSKRRAKHAKSHGITVEELGARRWTEAPRSKLAGKLV